MVRQSLHAYGAALAGIMASATLHADTSIADKPGSDAKSREKTIARLYAFATEGCAFLRHHPFDAHERAWTPRKLAGHFGHVLHPVDRGLRPAYAIAVADFPRWSITYVDRGVTLALPPSVSIKLVDLARRFGRPERPDVDIGLRPNFDNPSPDDLPPEEWDEDWNFPSSADAKRCRLTASTKARDFFETDSQPVTSFGFSDF